MHPPVFLFAAIAIAVSWFLQTQPNPRSKTLHPALTFIVLLHSLFILHAIFVSPPPNIFHTLRLPLSASSDAIRTALIQHTYASQGHAVADIMTLTLPDHTENLLKKLQSFEARTLYVRFGHDVLHCTYCHSATDFALYALPRPLLQYIRTAAIVGLLTLRGTRKEYWRTMGVGVLAGALVAECWWISTVKVSVNTTTDGVAQRGVMWHDLLWTLRHVLFLLIPPVLLALPPTFPTDPLSALPQALADLESLTTRMHLLKYMRGATMRVPSLRAHASSWWTIERHEGISVRQDENVRHVAERLGVGFDECSGEGTPEGKLRTTAKMTVRALMGGFVPSQYWTW